MKINYYMLRELSAEQIRAVCRRASIDLTALTETVAPIIKDVRLRGDEAVREYTSRFDGADMQPSSFRVPVEDIDRAMESLPAELVDAMKVSIENIRRFHEHQLPRDPEAIEIMPGITAGERTVPIRSVALYVPRGKGSFPSMMMMAGVPAMVAGVPRVVVMTPPDSSGKADPATVAAASMIGIGEIYAVGGVQAVAAAAFGTEHIPRVDKIVGPGSGYVLAAKQLLSMEVDTGLPAGPSEAIILADDSADPMITAVDLLIEAEHGPDSAAYLVTPSIELTRTVMHLLPGLVAKLPEDRREYCETVFAQNGGIVLSENMDDAVAFVNEFAPEHLQILTRQPESLLDVIRTAGEILLGPFTPGTLANYSLGPNAILPTSGFARTASALSVRDFMRTMSYSRVTETGFHELAPKTLVLARYEGFAAHARALEYRLEQE